jgi:hypothetical protein
MSKTNIKEKNKTKQKKGRWEWWGKKKNEIDCIFE